MLKYNRAAYQKLTNQFSSKEKTVLPKQLQNHPKVLFSGIDIYNGKLVLGMFCKALFKWKHSRV